MATNNALNNRSSSGFTVTGGVLALPTTTSTVGQITINSNRFMHAYGSNNVFTGTGSGNFTTTGDGDNIGIGRDSLSELTTGSRNTSIGAQTTRIVSGSENVQVGYNSGGGQSGDYNVAIGSQALNGASGASSNNVAIGGYAMTAIYGDFNGSNNIAIGYEAGKDFGFGNPCNGNIWINSLGSPGDANTLRIGAGTGGTGQSLQSAFIHGIYDQAAGANEKAVLIGDDGKLGTVAKSAVGSFVLIQSQTANNSASLVFSTGIDSTYTNYVLVISGYQPSTSNTDLRMEVSSNGGSSYVATGLYSSTFQDRYDNGVRAVGGPANNVGYYLLGQGITTSSGDNPYCATIYLYNLSSSTIKQTGRGSGMMQDGVASKYLEIFATNVNTATATNALRFTSSSGNLGSGVFSLYGIVS